MKTIPTLALAAALLVATAPLSALAASPSVSMSVPVIYADDLVGTDYTLSCTDIGEDTSGHYYVVDLYDVTNAEEVYYSQLQSCTQSESFAGLVEQIGYDGTFEMFVYDDNAAQLDLGGPPPFAELTNGTHAWFVGTSTFQTSSSNRP